MAQLRQDYDQFVARDAEIVVVGPEDARSFERYWQKENLPFVGLPDPEHTVLKRYGQEVKLFKLGRMPAQVIVDKRGQARYVHYGHSMSDIPANGELLTILEELKQEVEFGKLGSEHALVRTVHTKTARGAPSSPDVEQIGE